MLLMDAVLSFPTILVAIAVVSVFGFGLTQVMVALCPERELPEALRDELSEPRSTVAVCTPDESALRLLAQVR